MATSFQLSRCRLYQNLWKFYTIFWIWGGWFDYKDRWPSIFNITFYCDNRNVVGLAIYFISIFMSNIEPSKLYFSCLDLQLAELLPELISDLPHTGHCGRR